MIYLKKYVIIKIKKKEVFIILSIVIYSDHIEDTNTLKSFIQDFLIEQKCVAKVSVFSSAPELITVPNRCDLYILDMDSQDDAISLAKEMKVINPDCKFIYSSNDADNAKIAVKAKANYFVLKPYEKEEIIEILHLVRKEIREDSIIIKIPQGERRIRINNLNYVNIVKRCLCYHLKDGAMFDG